MAEVVPDIPRLSQELDLAKRELARLKAEKADVFVVTLGPNGLGGSLIELDEAHLRHDAAMKAYLDALLRKRAE